MRTIKKKQFSYTQSKYVVNYHVFFIITKDARKTTKKCFYICTVCLMSLFYNKLRFMFQRCCINDKKIKFSPKQFSM